jgi:aromatic ring-opening dioxygenase LigB subunit
MLAAFLLPHGALILDPKHDHNLRSKDDADLGPRIDAQTLHDASIICAQNIANLQPDIILLITPHGITLENDFGVYLNETARGTAEWKEEYHSYTASVSIDCEASSALIKHLKQNQIAVQGIVGHSRGEPAQLRWGEVVPLYFVQFATLKPKYVILSIPARRSHEDMTDELTKLGSLLNEFFLSNESVQGKRSVVIVSGDLAHTHSVSPSIPIPKGVLGTSESAGPYDDAIQQWISTGESRFLLEEAKTHLNQAKSCGHSGFIIVCL